MPGTLVPVEAAQPVPVAKITPLAVPVGTAQPVPVGNVPMPPPDNDSVGKEMSELEGDGSMNLRRPNSGNAAADAARRGRAAKNFILAAGYCGEDTGLMR